MNRDSAPATGFSALAMDLERRFAQGLAPRWDEAEFEALAEQAFRLQFEANHPYRALCESRGVTPATLSDWRDVPLVPAMAFGALDLMSTAGAPEAVFLTSGTTRGAPARGRHLVPALSLYRASLLGPFRRHVLADEAGLRFLSLVPPADMAPHSSLSYMVSTAAEALSREVHWAVDADGSLDLDGFVTQIEASARKGDAIVLLGTSLAFVHLLDRLSGRAVPPLPSGSRVMETGGFKGMQREVSRAELHQGLAHTLGVHPERIVGEYGMTELLSQLYEPVLAEGIGARDVYVAPPWLRVRALDPTSLEPVAEGTDGLLAFYDLANLGSVCHVLTQDVGSLSGGRLRLHGRIAGAEPRGCSRAMDELMSVTRHGP